VSTKEQTENLSLPTQLRACEEYCRREGFEVLERFREEGESAKTTDRSELQALLKYCRTHKGKVHFVVVYNLTRFARQKYDHFALHAHLKSLGILLRSATEPIDDTSTGKLMEGVLAAFAQFDNDVRSERTLAGMRAALSLGRWTFKAPLGYLLVNGQSPTDAELSRLVRATSAAEVRRLLAELVNRGVLSKAGDGAVYSRRMVRKAKQSAVGQETGQRGGNPTLRPKADPVNRAPVDPPLTVGDNGRANPQKLEAIFQTLKAPCVLTDDALAVRAGDFLQRYPAIYAKCRGGAHYRPKEARDFPTAIELVSAHPVDGRLDEMLEVFLRMSSDACRGMNKPGSVGQFASWAPECDRMLREHGR
jgi:DNA invertase Pin-like site-specific DNA recombinase